jgi:carbamoyl-phosphate synthase large subunit
VQNVLDAEAATGQLVGVIVALGGQTPLKLSSAISPDLVLGTSPGSIDLAEDRERWNSLCERLGIPQAAGGTATSLEEALTIAEKVGYPVLVRPSYVLGGRAMEIAYGEEDLQRAMGAMAVSGSLGREGGLSAERPVLVDRFLEDATEVDVDAVRDAAGETLIGAVMEHVEEAGVHSGDSACVVPPPTLSPAMVGVIEGHTRAIADALEVKGPLNVQYAVQRGAEGAFGVFVIEANPRASRTVPFVSKATGVPLAKVAARVMAGATLGALRAEGLLKPPVTGFVSVKEAVLPFDRFPDADSLLGPEMRSTGEVMGIDATFGLAFSKSQLAAGDNLADGGTVFFSVADRDKRAGMDVAKRFVSAGFTVAATSGTAACLKEAGVTVGTVVAKISEAAKAAAEGRATGGVDAVELIRSGKVQLVVNTPRGRGPRSDGAYIRRAARQYKVPLLTTLAAARAAAAGVIDRAQHPLTVKSLQEHHMGL